MLTMKITKSLVLSFLLVAAFTTLSFPKATDAQFIGDEVYDSFGDPVVPTKKYELQVTALEGLSVDTDNCPQNVVLSNELVRTVISPVVNDPFVRVDTNVNIGFFFLVNQKTCLSRHGWTVVYNATMDKRVVTLGGFGDERFRIVKTDKEYYYKLLFCYHVGIIEFPCVELGIAKKDGKSYVVVNGDPMQVVFKPQIDASISSRARARARMVF